ncbi:Glycoside hydrolase family 13 protein [Mycena chlorophos]|uniref:alpha-amylase n=1 Tax=Mycena chlorophos TaxID=658473 RepID=A0A8H6SP34_MYCCL|nr:Glycoside hydrolase family 13 protein [Mycena chlorophos]
MRLLPLLILASPVPSLAANAADWASRSIYQLVTDRFALPSSSSSTPCDTTKRTFCGGSWSGITNHLDYIQSMGFDAIWISPIVTNVDGTAYGDGYHGYWTLDLTTPTSHFGSTDDLKALSAALHKRGMYLMLDVVVNHFAAPPLNNVTLASNVSTEVFANAAALLKLNYTVLQPFSTSSDFHPPRFISDYTNQTDVEHCWLGDTLLPLPDVDTEDETVQAELYAWVKNMVNEYGADGVRIDTVKHIRQDFWRGFSDSGGVFTLGEVLTDNATYASSYIGTAVDAVLDYPAWYNVMTAFGNTTGNLSALFEAPSLAALATSTVNSSALTASFLENHDQPRFPSVNSDPALLMNAMTWTFVGDGIPILYYGQEQGYTGGQDPSNREALWLSGYATDKPLVAHVTSLNAARKMAIASNKTFLASRSQWLAQPNQGAVMLSKPPLLALMTNVGSSNNNQPTWVIPPGTYPANTTLVDVLACQKFTINANASAGSGVTASGGMPKVLVPDTLLSKGGGGACPALAAGVSGAIGTRLQGHVGGMGVAVAAMAAAAGVVGVV